MGAEPKTKKQAYVVFQRSDSSTWAMRFTLPGHPQIRIGLGTDDEQTAHSLARHNYLEAKVKADNGLLTGAMSFNKVALGYLDAIRKEAERNPKRLPHAKNAEALVSYSPTLGQFSG
jgi:hypothetical protein